MATADDAIVAIDEWYAGLVTYQDGLPARGSIAAALHLLSRLRANYDLQVSTHIASGGAQIVGLSTASVAKVLAEFGESRPLSATGGRSNRGARGDVTKLLDALRPLRLNAVSDAKRVALLKSMQRHLVTACVSLYFSVKPVRATYDPSVATWRTVQNIFENARANGKSGAVAEYMVGAKLALKFPDLQVRNKRFSAADAQAGLSSDFQLGNTAFHVTVAPMAGLLEKCKHNLESGLRVYLIVPYEHLVGTRQNAELQAAGRIAVESFESFVATNIDELAKFDGDQLKSGFRCFLETYNRRVDEIETDKSMLIEIPANLA